MQLEANNDMWQAHTQHKSFILSFSQQKFTEHLYASPSAGHCKLYTEESFMVSVLKVKGLRDILMGFVL